MTDYYSDDRLSNSKLSVLARSPEQFERQFIAKVATHEETDDMRFGRLLHCMVFEEDRVDEQFMTCDKVDRRTKEGKAEFAKQQEYLGCRTRIDIEDYALAFAIKDKLMHYAGIGGLLQLNGSIHEAELRFERGGVQFKAKLDLLNVDYQLIVDLKTTQDPRPESFARSVVDYGYHRQVAIYQDAVKQLYGVDCRFLFIAVNKKEPFTPAIHELSSDLVWCGHVEVDALIEELKRRKEANNWVSDWASGNINTIEKPRWY